jgi:hypothetical protein
MPGNEMYIDPVIGTSVEYRTAFPLAAIALAFATYFFIQYVRQSLMR